MKDAEEAGFSPSPRGHQQSGPDQGYGSHDPRSPAGHPSPWGQGHQWDRGREPLREANGQLPRQQPPSPRQQLPQPQSPPRDRGYYDTAKDYG